MIDKKNLKQGDLYKVKKGILGSICDRFGNDTEKNVLLNVGEFCLYVDQYKQDKYNNVSIFYFPSGNFYTGFYSGPDWCYITSNLQKIQ